MSLKEQTRIPDMTPQEIHKFCSVLIRSSEMAQHGDEQQAVKAKQDIVTMMPLVSLLVKEGHAAALYARFRMSSNKQTSLLSRAATGGHPQAMVDWATLLVEHKQFETASVFIAKVLAGNNSCLKDEVKNLLLENPKLAKYTDTRLNPTTKYSFFSVKNSDTPSNPANNYSFPTPII